MFITSMNLCYMDSSIIHKYLNDIRQICHGYECEICVQQPHPIQTLEVLDFIIFEEKKKLTFTRKATFIAFTRTRDTNSIFFFNPI